MTAERKARGPVPPGVPRVEPWKPADYEPADVTAVREVAYGRASEDQQRRAMRFIIERLAGTYDLSYRSEKPNDTAFAEGKRFVGLQVVKLINLNLAGVTGTPSEQGGARTIDVEHPA